MGAHLGPKPRNVRCKTASNCLLYVTDIICCAVALEDCKSWCVSTSSIGNRHMHLTSCVMDVVRCWTAALAKVALNHMADTQYVLFTILSVLT